MKQPTKKTLARPRRPGRKRVKGPRVLRSRAFLIAAAIVVLLALVAGGIGIAVSGRRAEGPEAHDNALALAREYLERGEFQSAQDILNGLLLENANDPAARALLDELITAKKAAEEAARQEGLAAQRDQQDRLQASLDELGQNIRRPGPPSAS